MEEIWKDIKGFEGLYQVSNFGEVKSLPRNGTILKPRTLVGFIDDLGYHQVVLTSKKVHKKIHRLVALAFIPNPENKPCVNHKNRIRTDNRVTNLEWCTYKENTTHSFANGHKAKSKSDHAGSKISELESEIIQECLLNDFKRTDIARYFRICVTTINNIAKNKHWTNYRPQAPSRLVLDLQTGVYYGSANEVAKLYGVSQPTVADRIKYPNKAGKIFQVQLAYV